jgi:hypothetical protein
MSGDIGAQTRTKRQVGCLGADFRQFSDRDLNLPVSAPLVSFSLLGGQV